MATEATTLTDTELAQEVSLSVVAPAYNEAENLPGLVDEVQAACRTLDRSHEIVIVDDGSEDDTQRVLAHLAETVAQVRGVQLARNWGQSAALAAGIDHARGDTIVTIDADLQNDPADIPRLLDRLEDGYDCVSGNRADRQDPLGKRIPSNIQMRLAKLTGPDIDDFGCTLTAYRADALAEVPLYGEGHRYIPAELYDRGYDITELNVNHRERAHGDSHYGAGRLIRGAVDLLWHLVWNRYSTRPMHLLGGGGSVLFGLGVLLGLVSLVQRYVLGVPLDPRTPRLILVALLTLFGLQLVVFGVIVEFLSRMYYSEETPYRVAQVMEGS